MTMLCIKVHFLDEIRRFKFEPSSELPALTAKIQTLFSLPAQALVLKWKDEEGDLITFSSDEEMGEAFKSLSDPSVPLHVFATLAEQRNQENSISEEEGSSSDEQVSPKQWRVKLRADKKIARLEAKQQRIACKKERIACWKGRQNNNGFRGRQREWKRAKELKAEFVRHVSIPDHTQFAPEESFVKTWTLKNGGSRRWGPNYSLVFISRRQGHLMGTTGKVRLGHGVAPGEEVDVSVPMVAPTEPGSYVGFWKLETGTGLRLGPRVWVKIEVVDPSAGTTAAEEPVVESSDAPLSEEPALSDTSAETDTATEESAGQSVQQQRNDTPERSEAQPTALYLVQLRDMGFVDVQTNIALLKKYKNDLSRVVIALLN